MATLTGLARGQMDGSIGGTGQSAGVTTTRAAASGCGAATAGPIAVVLTVRPSAGMGRVRCGVVSRTR